MSKANVEPISVPVDDDAEVFKSFGIDDEDDQHRIRVLAAARVLASRKLNKQPAPASKKRRSLFGEE